MAVLTDSQLSEASTNSKRLVKGEEHTIQWYDAFHLSHCVPTGTETSYGNWGRLVEKQILKIFIDKNICTVGSLGL